MENSGRDTKIQTISQISKAFNLSTRTLRYYEKIGLIKVKELKIILTVSTVRKL